MTDDEPDRVESECGRSQSPGHFEEPWWWGLGPVGAVVVILGGLAAAVWTFLGLPGVGDDPAVDYYQASRIIAIGLVIVGSVMLERFRARARSGRKGTYDEREPEVSSHRES